METPDEDPTAKVEPGPSEKTYILRHRALEDAMVVAEQQGTSALPSMSSLSPARLMRSVADVMSSWFAVEVGDEGYHTS